MKRHRFKQDRTVGERLIKEARLAREKAGQLPPGQEREKLLKKVREADGAIDDSPRLRPPK
jgi:hypothetical protein